MIKAADNLEDKLSLASDFLLFYILLTEKAAEGPSHFLLCLSRVHTLVHLVYSGVYQCAPMYASVECTPNVYTSMIINVNNTTDVLHLNLWI